jgi:hypothetical protein
MTNSILTTNETTDSRQPACEVWRAVVGFEGHYEVSDHGRVRSLDRRIPRKVSAAGRGGAMLRRGKILSPTAVKKSGHLYVTLSTGTGCTPVKTYVHRMVLEAFVGPCPDGFECLHSDSEAGNNRLGNIEWGSRNQNNLDRIPVGALPVGEKCHLARFTSQQVADIRQRARTGEHHKSIAKDFGTSANYVWHLVTNRSRKHDGRLQ